MLNSGPTNLTPIAALPLEDLIHLRMPEDEARQWLLRLTPEQVTSSLLKQLIQTVQQTALAMPDLSGPLMDCCGTGGSGISHFNTSTTVSFVLASGGVRVVKFGNRAMSSQSGSFDFLESLGFPPEINPEHLPQLLERSNLAFLYAPQCYPCLAPFNQLRKALGVRTIFNFIGPLLNPVKPSHRILGVSHIGMQNLLAQYLTESSPETQKAWVVHSPFENTATQPSSGLDEIACEGRTRILEVESSKFRETLIARPSLGIQLNPIAHQPEENVGIFRQLISGDDQHSTYYQMVCLNAGAGLHVAGQAASLEDGIALAKELLGSHKVQKTFEACRRAYDDLNQ